MRKTNQNVDPKQVTIEENQVDTTPNEAKETEEHVEAEVPAENKPVQKESLLKKGSDKLLEMEDKRLQKKEAKEKKKAEKAEAKAAKKADNAGKGKGLKIAAGIGIGLLALGAIGKALADSGQGNAEAPIPEVPGEPLMLEDGNTIIEESSVEEPVPETDGNNKEETM